MSAKLETTHIVTENGLVVYRRERSSIWQCRYKVDGVWQRASTKERMLKDAKEVAKALKIRAEIRKHDNLPVITRKFRDVAKLAVQRMEQKIANPLVPGSSTGGPTTLEVVHTGDILYSLYRSHCQQLTFCFKIRTKLHVLN
jgi:hypothetical protein